MNWYLSALGHVSGTAVIDGTHHEIASQIALSELPHDARVSAHGGKLGNSEDSFAFLYTRIDPSTENFTFSATVTASEIDEQADQQSGYGLIAVDTDASNSASSCHRNQLLVGCLGKPGLFGVRAVAGYLDSEARPRGGTRIVDQSRRFSSMSPEAYPQAPHTFCMAKTDVGFSLSCDGECVQIPGCDFLMKQQEHAIYVGFAAARGIDIAITDISFQVTPGASSHTPEDAITLRIPDYPFPREILVEAPSTVAPETPVDITGNATIYVAPDGIPGAGRSPEEPTTIGAALQLARPGTDIILADGVYTPAAPLIASVMRSGSLDAPITLRAQHARRSIIDGSHLSEGNPLFVIDGDFWHVEGVVFRNSPLSGLVICGNVNRISNCEAYGNGDTGMLVISRPGAERSAWPQRNFVVDCDSHDNCDTYGCNADGFGAKLRIGRGNAFYHCIAHHNIDDGFDLYTKYLFGATEPVELDGCVAYCNGFLSSGRTSSKGAGIGFKLGGESQAVAHEAWNCLAVNNRQAGFSNNSNPSCQLRFCTAGGNGASNAADFLVSSPESPLRGRKTLLRISRRAKLPSDAPIALRTPEGGITINKAFRPRRHGGRRLGASIGERKNLLVVIASLSGGGAERVACKLATALSEKHAVSMMFLAPNNVEPYYVGPDVKLIDASITALGPAHTIPAKIRRRLLFKTRGAALLLKAHLLDHVHTTISLLEAPNKANALFGGKRKVLCERNDPQQKPKGYYSREKFNYWLADYVVFQSRKVQEEFSKAIQRKSCIIPNPVSVTCHARPASSKKIVTAGRLHPQKNHALLIEAFAAFHATHPQHTLHIFGDGALKEDLLALVESLGLQQAVCFEGFCDDVHAAISDAEMFVLSSDYEGMSNALIEAMMMGLPCISTACTGSDELITDGEDGLLVPVGSANGLCEAMTRLADDAELQARLAYGARLRALDFRIDDVIRKWERIL